MVELLTEILAHAAYEYKQTHAFPAVARMNRLPFSPVLVCTLWSDIGLDHLWETANVEKLLGLLVPVKLERFGVGPFDFTLTIRESWMRSPSRFLLYAEKVRHLDLVPDISPRLAEATASHVPQYFFPRLRSLRIRVIPASQAVLFIKRSPNLEDVQLEEVPLGLDRTLDESLALLPPSLRRQSLRRLEVRLWPRRNKDPSTPSVCPITSTAAEILLTQTSIMSVTLRLPDVASFALLCSRMAGLHHLTSCKLAFSWPSSQVWTQVSSLLALNCRGLRTLHLRSALDDFHRDANVGMVTFNGFMIPLLSLSELEDLAIDMSHICLHATSDQISSMASSWPRMRELELRTQEASPNGIHATARSSLLSLRAFRASLERLTTVVSFDDLPDVPRDFVLPMKKLSQLHLHFSKQPDPSDAVRVAKILDSICTEQTQIQLNDGYTIEELSRCNGWAVVHEVLQALRRARERDRHLIRSA